MSSPTLAASQAPRSLGCARRESHRVATTAIRGQDELSLHDAYGNRLDPPKGFVPGDGAAIAEPNSAVTTRSPSFKPSTTSVRIPSLIPVLICAACGRPAPDGKTYTVRSVPSDTPPLRPSAGRPMRLVPVFLLSTGVAFGGR